MTGHADRARSIGVVLLLLVAGTAIGCGESDEEKAQNEVCDARDDLQQQVNAVLAAFFFVGAVVGIS